MDATEFIKNVIAMRSAQKLYFLERSKYALSEAKRLEKIVDKGIISLNEEIKITNDLLTDTGTQYELFC